MELREEVQNVILSHGRILGRDGGWILEPLSGIGMAMASLLCFESKQWPTARLIIKKMP